MWYSRYNQYRDLTVNIPYCILSMSEPVWQSPRFPPTLTTKLHRTRPSFQSVWNMCKKIQEQSWKKVSFELTAHFPRESNIFFLCQNVQQDFKMLNLQMRERPADVSYTITVDLQLSNHRNSLQKSLNRLLGSSLNALTGCVGSICWFLFSCRGISFAFNRTICINETYFQNFFCNLIAM